MTGTVYLVGAGPGDPGLLTSAGRDALARADVVFHDRLAHPALLALAPETAQRFFVGKESARHYVRQEDTNALMAEQALAGRTVVRLKGGDPLVFGRGAEEAEYLRERGIPFVFIPGVTSAIAALAYAGIPITHRDASSSFAVITGHERDDRRESGSRAAGAGEQRRRWDRIAHAADTLVFLMGVENLANIRDELVRNGRAESTPVALVQWGTWPRQRTVCGTLATIVDDVRAAGLTAPAVTVVGDVVRFREKLRWFDSRPLFGKTVVVTRARDQASELSSALRSLGADVIEHPVFSVAAPADDGAALIAAVGRLGDFNWICFTSGNAVERFFQCLASVGRDARALAGVRCAVVGEATGTALARFGVRPDFTASQTLASSLGRELPNPEDARVLIPQAAEAGNSLAENLRERGAAVETVEAYRQQRTQAETGPLLEAFRSGEVDALTFASSNTVRWFAEDIPASEIPAKTRLVAIGPITAATCEELLRVPDAVAEKASVDALVDCVVRTLADS
ncbi:MAG: uroporphyrinogen-III C-methyltransferase [Armatimonadota bacterium]